MRRETERRKDGRDGARHPAAHSDFLALSGMEAFKLLSGTSMACFFCIVLTFPWKLLAVAPFETESRPGDGGGGEADHRHCQADPDLALLQTVVKIEPASGELAPRSAYPEAPAQRTEEEDVAAAPWHRPSPQDRDSEALQGRRAPAAVAADSLAQKSLATSRNGSLPLAQQLQLQQEPLAQQLQLQQEQPATEPAALTEDSERRGAAQTEDGEDVQGFMPGVELGRPFLLERGMNGVSTSFKAITVLVVQFIAVHIFLIETHRGTTALSSTAPVTRGLQSIQVVEPAAVTANFAPMFGVLFVSAQMHAMEQTQIGRLWHGLPKPWAEVAMLCCSVALASQIFLQIQSKFELTACLHQIIGVLRQLSLVVLYATGVVVIVAIVGNSSHTSDVWIRTNTHSKLTTPMICTAILVIAYLAVYLVFQIVKTRDQFVGKGIAPPSYFTEVMRWVAVSVSYAPMVTMLFVALELRAGHLGYPSDRQPRYVLIVITCCTAAALAQIALAVLGPLARRDTPATGTGPGSSGGGGAHFMMMTLGWLATVIFWVAALMLAFMVLALEPRDGARATPVEPWLKCVVTLMVQYFIVHILVSVGVVMQRARGMVAVVWVRAFSAGKDASVFAPMLCVLFLGSALRAEQLAGGMWARQPAWVEVVMFVAAYVQLLYIVLSVLVAMVTLASQAERSFENSGDRAERSPGNSERSPTVELKKECPPRTENAAAKAVATLRGIALWTLLLTTVLVLVGSLAMTRRATSLRM